MNLLFKIALILSLAFGVLQAAGFEKEVKSKSLSVQLSSPKSLAVGLNTVQIALARKGTVLDGAKVSVKIFMPAMPGMPAMQSVTEAKPMGNGVYESELNFSMGGTWQMHIFITPVSGKKVRVKTSVNL